MQTPTFLCQPILHPLRATPPPIKCRFHRPATATFSLPSPSPTFRRQTHTEETKRKIGASVRASAARRRDRLLSMLETPYTGASNPETSSPSPKPNRERRRRRQTAESRAKISAALKGRAKTPEHRAKLRRRFVGDGNPMYGRKLSAESRAKISAAMSARKKTSGKGVEERDEMEEGGVVEGREELMEELREKATSSRLLSSKRPSSNHVKRNGERRVQLRAEEELVERVLGRVAGLAEPPEVVVRTRVSTRQRREEGKVEEVERQCEICGGSGFMKCPECVGAFGVVSGRCQGCFGAGAVFCERCLGVGQLAEGGKPRLTKA